MSAGDVTNWIAVYLLTFFLCVVCASLAAITVSIELYKERFWQKLDNAPAIILIMPRIWWRWQKRYLLGTPAILAIVLAFGLSLEWDAIG